MADSITRRGAVAVVTGANKGIGFAICKQLASQGVVVVLTARDQGRGLEAVNKLEESGLSDHVVFHQLDVADPASIASLAKFVRTGFGKLDILVNNAGVGGSILDAEALRVSGIGTKQVDWSKIATETYELTEECVRINFYGVKRMVEAFLDLLRQSDSPRIINVSSTAAKLEYIPEGWAKSMFSAAESLTEEKVDDLLTLFLRDFKEGTLESRSWPPHLSAYTVSKLAMNSYTRIIAAKYPDIRINCVCPGFVKTDINCNTGFSTPAEGAEGPVRLALLPDGGPSGRFFQGTKEASF